MLDQMDFLMSSIYSAVERRSSLPQLSTNDFGDFLQLFVDLTLWKEEWNYSLLSLICSSSSSSSLLLAVVVRVAVETLRCDLARSML